MAATDNPPFSHKTEIPTQLCQTRRHHVNMNMHAYLRVCPDKAPVSKGLMGGLFLTCTTRTDCISVCPDKAPVSKGLMGGLFLTCTAINVPLLAHLRHQLECRLPDVLGSPLLYRLVTSRLAFTDTKDLVCSALLIYYFRWVADWRSMVVQIGGEWCPFSRSVRALPLFFSLM